MKGKSKSDTVKLMCITTIVVVAVLLFVIAGFFIMHRDQKIQAARATEFSNPETKMAAVEDKEAREKEKSRTLLRGGVYLIKGEPKGCNKYTRTDKLAYTDSVSYSRSDLSHLDEYGMKLTRNEIFARHGRMFNDQDLQEYFDSQDWYSAEYSPGDFDDSCLNEVEKANVQLISMCEQECEYD